MQTGPRRPPTISDVARVAEVSLPTVSRVLTGRVPVSPPTRQRVMAAISALGYRPNGAARALVQGKQPIVGVVTTDTSGFGRARMLFQIEARARRDGYVVAVVVVQVTGLQENPVALDVLMAQPVLGVIVLDFLTHDPETLRQTFGSTPIATVADSVGSAMKVPNVVMDDHVAAREVTRHLLDLGHRTVHHVAVPGTQGQPHPRESGWREALTTAGVPVPPPLMSDWSLESGRALGAVLAADSSATAVFCSNDQLAFGVMRGLRDAGLEVPTDVSVAGLDDEPLGECWNPSLTSYRLDWDWAGGAVYDLLVNQLDGAAITGTPDLRLIPRDSTAAPSRTR